MAIIVKSDKGAIVFINTGSCNDWSAKITTDVFGDHLRVTFIGFGINIEAMFMFFVTCGFHLLKRRTEFCFHFIQKSSTKGIAKEVVIKVLYVSP